MTRILCIVGLLAAMLNAVSAAAQDRRFAQSNSASQEVDPEQLRQGARDGFTGFSQFSVPTSSATEPREEERSFIAACRAQPQIQAAVQRAAEARGLQRIGQAARFPNNSYMFARQRRIPAPTDLQLLDTAMIYFAVRKEGLDCAYTVGAIYSVGIDPTTQTTSVARGRFLAASQQLGQQLLTDLNSFFGQFEGLVKSVAAPFEGLSQTVQRAAADGRLDQFVSAADQLHSQDETVRQIKVEMEAAISAILEPYGQAASRIRFYVFKYEGDIPLIARTKLLYTETCMAIPFGLGVPAVVCNEAFVLDIIAVQMTFDAFTLFFSPDYSSDETMFALVRAFDGDRAEVARRVIADFFGTPKPAALVEDLLSRAAMQLLAVIGHELGHLAEGDGGLQFDERDMNPREVSAAILRLCRQADQFRREGMVLDHLEGFLRRGSDSRSLIDALRASAPAAERLDGGFHAETIADDYADLFMSRYIDRLWTTDRATAIRAQGNLSAAITSYAVFDLYRSIIRFSDERCGGTLSFSALTRCFGLDPQNFVKAASIFGEVHPSFIVRAFSISNMIVGHHTDFYAIPIELRSVMVDPATEPASLRTELRRTARVVVERHILLRMLDLPFKLATFGCISGYRHQQGRPPQMVIMQLFDLRQEAEVLRRILP